MAGLEPQIPIQGGRGIPSYDFVQFAQDQGLAQLYPADLANGSDILISTTGLYGALGYQRVLDNATLDVDFDIVITRPLNTGTTCYFQMPLSIDVGGSTAIGDDVVFYVRKVSGGVETDLGSTTITLSNGGFSSDLHYQLSEKITIPKTHFKIGDTLRFTLYAVIADHSGVQTWYFGCDPANRTGSTLGIGTNLANGARSVLYFPVKLDL